VDSIPGVASLDNLGIPESGDGIPDVLQEAKWEADFLAKMQDADGGFYFLVYPKDREYESNVLPENGDPQVVWPKSTSVTAAAVAALAEPVLPGDEAVLSAGRRPCTSRRRRSLAVPDERDRQIRQGRRLPEDHFLQRQLDSR